MPAILAKGARGQRPIERSPFQVERRLRTNRVPHARSILGSSCQVSLCALQKRNPGVILVRDDSAQTKLN